MFVCVWWGSLECVSMSGNAISWAQAGSIAGTTGGWFMSSRGSLLEAPHLIPGSNKQSVSILFEIWNNNLFFILRLYQRYGVYGVVGCVVCHVSVVPGVR